MYIFIKRLIDIFLALIILIATSPAWLLIMIILKVSGEGVIFYSQKRIGKNNRYFNMLKFATMLKGSPNMDTGIITVKNDRRVTKAGKILRKYKFNEFPQLINILTGDMSIIGPRPLVDETFNAYPQNIKNLIYNLRPGITGIGSIVFRDEESLFADSKLEVFEFYKNHIAPYKGQLELWYQKNISLKTDVIIMFLTLWHVIFTKSNLVFYIFNTLPKRPTGLLWSENKVGNNGEVMEKFNNKYKSPEAFP